MMFVFVQISAAALVVGGAWMMAFTAQRRGMWFALAGAFFLSLGWSMIATGGFLQ